jgi:phosphatidylglycerophosphatase A
MKDQNYTLGEKIARVFLSFFGTGLVPKAPGTMGSLATVPLLYVLYQINLNLITHLIIILIFTLISGFVTQWYQERKNLHDPGWIVIDEVLGMYLTWCFFPSDKALHLLAIFGLFRVFDILKIPPVSTLDKHIKHGIGVIVDDLAAAIYAGTTYYFLAAHYL